MNNLDKNCPVKTMKIGPQDKPFITLELKKLAWQKQREYIKRGKTPKCKKLQAEFNEKYNLAALKFVNDKKEELKTTEPGKAYRILRNLGAQPGDCTDSSTFTLPEHLNENLSPQQSADRIAQHFAAISSEYPPLDLDSLPKRVKVILSTKSTPPYISEYDCYQKIMKAKKPGSGVPGELPAQIIKKLL